MKLYRLLVFVALAGCYGPLPANTPSTTPAVLDWVAPATRNGVQGWIATDDAHNKWEVLLHFYGSKVFPPATDTGWTSLGNGQWFVTLPAQTAYGQMNFLRDNPGIYK